MHRLLLLLIGLSQFYFSVSLCAQTSDAELRVALERSYNKWRDASIKGDAQAWAAAITRYRQTVIRNSIVSDRRSFPAAIFETEVKPPDIAGLRLLEVQAVGQTAHLVYFGKIDLGQDKELVVDNILKLKFLSENGVWKYDSNRITRLDNVPEVRKGLQEGKPPDFLDSPEYTPPGTAPLPPPLCRVPEHKAGFKLQSYGYETTISMNGFDYDTVEDGLEQQVIIGGLMNGRNEVTLNIKSAPVPEGEKTALQFRVYILSADSDKPSTEVLRWEAPETGAPAKITLQIEVKR